MIHGGRLVAAAALVALATLSSGDPADAAADATCDGVLVVVAPGPADDASMRCATGAPSSGLAALTDVGHTYTFVPSIPGMVCTIDGHPDPCNGAPADAYWSYWHAEPGGAWVYSTRGAADREPPVGTVEGWVFGAGDPPSSSAPTVEGAAITVSAPVERVTSVRGVAVITAAVLIVGLGTAAVRRSRSHPGDGPAARSAP